MRDMNGRFIPGHPGLKPKGAQSEITKKTKEALSDFISGELETLREQVEKLTPSERVDFFLRLLPFILPKAQEIPPELSPNDITGIPLIKFISNPI